MKLLSNDHIKIVSGGSDIYAAIDNLLKDYLGLGGSPDLWCRRSIRPREQVISSKRVSLSEVSCTWISSCSGSTISRVIDAPVGYTPIQTLASPC